MAYHDILKNDILSLILHESGYLTECHRITALHCAIGKNNSFLDNGPIDVVWCSLHRVYQTSMQWIFYHWVILKSIVYLQEICYVDYIIF